MPDNLPRDWEMSPRYRILDSAEYRVTFAGEYRWQLHLIKQPSWNYSFLWMCPFDWHNDAGFIAANAHSKREHIFGAKETLQTSERKIYSIIKADGGGLARRFVLNTRGQLRRDNQRAHENLIVMRDGVAAWSHGHEVAPFRWRETPLTGAEFVRIPAAQIWDELQLLFADPDGEANFARRYVQLDPIARRERIQKPARGTLAELNSLLHDIVLASPQWGALQGESELYLSIDKSGDFATWEMGSGNPIQLETPTFVRQNVRRLWNYFEPFDRAIAKFLCVKNSNENMIAACAFQPSAHQQLEAQLRLRDWKRAHLAKGQCCE